MAQNPKTGSEELRHIVLEQMDVRVDPSADKESLHDLLQYRIKKLPESPINKLRDELISFIKENRSKLSLPCDGDCYQHHDGVVIYCHKKLLEVKTNG